MSKASLWFHKAALPMALIGVKIPSSWQWKYGSDMWQLLQKFVYPCLFCINLAFFCTNSHSKIFSQEPTVFIDFTFYYFVNLFSEFLKVFMYYVHVLYFVKFKAFLWKEAFSGHLYSNFLLISLNESRILYILKNSENTFTRFSFYRGVTFSSTR